MSSAWTKAVLGNRAAACESPIAANHPISPVAVQRMISQARLKISHAPRRVTWKVNGATAMQIARQWASNSSIDASAKAKFIEKESINTVWNNLDLQVLRLNAFMSLAMRRLENIRVRYRPTGFLCHVPIVREVVGLLRNRCRPIHTAEN